MVRNDSIDFLKTHIFLLAMLHKNIHYMQNAELKYPLLPQITLNTGIFDCIFRLLFMFAGFRYILNNGVCGIYGGLISAKSSGGSQVAFFLSFYFC